MKPINIVLVEPEIPPNTGNIARTCAALEAVLHLVHPLGFSLDNKYLKRAGLDYWPSVSIVEHENLAAFLAFSSHQKRFFFSTKAERNYTNASFSEGCYLVFGKETAGLPEELLRKFSDHSYRIPMSTETRSLNLSNSVAVAAYECARQLGFSNLVKTATLSDKEQHESAKEL